MPTSRPSNGPSTGGTVVTIAGTNFSAPASVAFGGQPATDVTVVNGNEIRATSPGHAVGTVSVEVTTPSGSATLPNSFTYQAFTSTNQTLAFGDSITSGITSFFNPSSGFFDFVLVADPYPEILQGSLQARYTSQSILVRNSGVAGECASATCGGGRGAERIDNPG